MNARVSMLTRGGSWALRTAGDLLLRSGEVLVDAALRLSLLELRLHGLTEDDVERCSLCGSTVCATPEDCMDDAPELGMPCYECPAPAAIGAPHCARCAPDDSDGGSV